MKRSAGFSLLEILVAFSVLALSLGVIMQIVGETLRQVTYVTQRSQAVQLAQTLMTELTTQVTDPSVELSGVQGDSLAWTFTARPFEVGGTTPTTPGMVGLGLFEYSVVIHALVDGVKERSLIELRTLKVKRRTS